MRLARSVLALFVPLVCVVAMTFISGCASATGAFRPQREMAADGYYDDMGDSADENEVSLVTAMDGDFRSADRPRSSRPAPPSGAMGGAGRGMASESAPVDGTSTPDARPEDVVSKPEPTAPTPKRLIIYTAQFSLLVPDPETSIELFVGEVKAAGGYLSQRANGQVTVRVPAAKFTPLLERLPFLGTVTSRRVSSQDVTAQFRDIELRLDTAVKSRARLALLLERAEKMEDILRIEKELRRLTEEIEVMKGRLRLLSDQISFSTITVNFQQNAPSVLPLSKRRRSRFSWINRIGLERVLSDF